MKIDEMSFQYVISDNVIMEAVENHNKLLHLLLKQNYFFFLNNLFIVFMVIVVFLSKRHKEIIFV